MGTKWLNLQLLLSLILLSCILAFRRELANTLNISTFQPHNNQPSHLKYFLINLEIILPKGQFLSPSINSQRDTSVSLSVFSMDYAECIEAYSRKLIYAKQVVRGE